MPVLSTRTQLVIGITLVLLLAITRGNHFVSINLPSASWAVFFLAGVLLRPRWVFAGFFALVSALDFSLLSSATVSDWCLSPAYWMLVPAYASLWLGGRLYAGWHTDTLQSLLLLVVVMLVSALICNLLSGGGFYFFSGRYPDPTLAGWWPRIVEYYPRFLSSMGLYVGVASAIYIAALALFGQYRSLELKG